jgi:hypothetical protein
MSNPMVKALDDIEMEIGPQILKAFFEKADFYLCSSPINMRTRIQEEIIERRVLVDMDIVGGTEAYIPLDHPSVKCEYIDPMTVMYQVPDELTQNRPIRQIYSVHFGILNYSVATGVLRGAESALGGELRKVLDSALRTPPAATTYINLVNHNTFIVKYTYLPYSAAFLRCRLGNDEALGFIRPQAILDFAELCMLATQAYIYSQYEIAIGQAYLSGGQELGAFADRVRKWEDKWTEYRTKLKVWKNVSQNFNDPEARRRNLRSLVGAP